MRRESAAEQENPLESIAEKAIGNYLRNLLLFSVKSVISRI